MPVPNTAVVINRQWGSGISSDICMSYIHLTDQRAATVLYGFNRPKSQTALKPFATAAFHCDRDFITVDHVIDAGEAQAKMSSDDLSKDLLLALFECNEFPIYPLADSSLVSV